MCEEEEGGDRGAGEEAGSWNRQVGGGMEEEEREGRKGGGMKGGKKGERKREKGEGEMIEFINILLSVLW